MEIKSSIRVLLLSNFKKKEPEGVVPNFSYILILIMSNEEANHSVEDEYALDPKWARNALGNNRQRTGKFSREESEIVRKAVEEYCAMKQVEVARLCSEW